MGRKIMKLLCLGIAWGCTFFCIISVFGVAWAGYGWFLYSPGGFAGQVAASMAVGAGFSVPAVVYENEKLSRFQQCLIQMGIGLAIYLTVAYFMRWLPTESAAAVAGGAAVAVMVSLAVWFGFYLYYRGEARAINRRLREGGEEASRSEQGTE